MTVPSRFSLKVTSTSKMLRNRRSAKRIRLSNVRTTAGLFGLLIGPHVWAMETDAYVPSREPGLGTEDTVPTNQRAADC